MKLIRALIACIVLVSILWASGVVPAIIPQAVPAANKQGNSTKFQLAGTNSGTAGNVLCNDANGNTTDIACSGAATSTPFSGITTSSNTTATMTLGAGGSLVSTSTGIVETNKLRNYTVATLPGSPATGAQAYVTDGATTTDCSAGSGSTKVFCQYNGSAWAAVGAGSSTTFYPTSGTTMAPLWSITLPPASGWTWFNQGTATNSTTFGYLRLDMTTIGGSAIRAYCRAVPATPFSIYTMIQDDASGSSSLSSVAELYGGVGFSDGTKYYTIQAGTSLGKANFNTGKWNTTGSFNAYGTLNDTPAANSWIGRGTKWYRLSDDGTTNIKFYYSIDGQNWTLTDTAARTGFLASVTNFCYCAYADTGPYRVSVFSYTTDSTP